MPSLGRYFDYTMQRIGTQSLRLWRCSATETLLLHFMLVRSNLPAQSAASSICKICSAPRWSWESSSTWKPSWHHRVVSPADSRRAKRVLWRWVFIVASLAASHGYILAQDKIIYGWDVQRNGRPIKAEKVRKKQLALEAALASRASSSLKIC